MKEVVLKYGIRSAAVMIALSWISFFITRGMSPWVAQLASMAIIVASLTLVYGAMAAEEKRVGTKISFWGYFFTGALTGLIPAAAMIVSTLIFMLTAGKAFSSWSAGEAGNAVVMNPVEQGIIMFLIVLFLGSIMSLIGAIFFSSRKA